MSLAQRKKQWTTRNLQTLCAHRNPVPTFVPKYKVSTLYSGSGTLPEFQGGYLEKGCVHIGAQQVLHSGTATRHQV